MNIKLTAVSVKHIFGRNMVVCVPRNAETGQQLELENSLSQVVVAARAAGHTIVNAEEVLECVVSKYGFGA
jgi:hypothetical protein